MVGSGQFDPFTLLDIWSHQTRVGRVNPSDHSLGVFTFKRPCDLNFQISKPKNKNKKLIHQNTCMKVA